LNKKNGVENMKKFICSLLLAAIFCHITAYASSPAAWAIADVENAIVAGYVPKEIQSEYTLPVKRSEFCHMAINFLCHELGLTFEELADLVNPKGIICAEIESFVCENPEVMQRLELLKEILKSKNFTEISNGIFQKG